MTGTLGRKMRFTAFVVTGNKKGLAGYGLGKSQSGKAAIRLVNFLHLLSVGWWSTATEFEISREYI